jgi:hypothetical protein
MKKKPWTKKKKFSVGKKSKRFDVAILRENSLLEKIRQSSRQKIFNSLVFRKKKKLIKKEN